MTETWSREDGKNGERVLLPAVRESLPETLIIADGFSCNAELLNERAEGNH